MAHVEDRWFREVVADGSKTKIKTARHGTGLRFRARWNDPDGAERSESFKRKGDAERKIAAVEGDKLRGTYVDARAGRITLREYGEDWLAAQTFDVTTREVTALRLRLHVYPYLGERELGGLRPSHIQAWLRGLSDKLAATTVKVTFGNLSSVLNAAVDDERIITNPCRANSVRLTRPEPKQVIPWTHQQVHDVQAALPSRYQILSAIGSGAGMRQGEIFGLAVEDVDFLGRTITIGRQVRLVGARLCFALPKMRRTRKVPLPEQLALDLSAHIRRFPPVEVTLPWDKPGGQPTTVRLIATSREHGALNRHYVNHYIWKPALRAAKMPDGRDNGMHALRHWYASALLDGGMSIKVVSAYLGHSDEGFTLRTYTHLMADSQDRARAVVNQAIQRTRSEPSDGPGTAQTSRP